MIPVNTMTERELINEGNKLEIDLKNQLLTYDLAQRLYEIRKALKRINSLKKESLD